MGGLWSMREKRGDLCAGTRAAKGLPTLGYIRPALCHLDWPRTSRATYPEARPIRYPLLTTDKATLRWPLPISMSSKSSI